jgi:hypothetical protein
MDGGQCMIESCFDRDLLLEYPTTSMHLKQLLTICCCSRWRCRGFPVPFGAEAVVPSTANEAHFYMSTALTRPFSRWAPVCRVSHAETTAC